MNKPREFWMWVGVGVGWIIRDKKPDPKIDADMPHEDGVIHVIEKSAYDKAVLTLGDISEQTDMGGAVLEESAYMAKKALKELGEIE